MEFSGEPLIREESVEAEASGDGRPDAAGNLAEDEEKKSSSTDQQTQESAVCLITCYDMIVYCSTADEIIIIICYLYFSLS